MAKEKNSKMNFITIKTYASKNSIKKMKRQPIELKRLIVHYTPHRWPIKGVYSLKKNHSNKKHQITVFKSKMF